MTKRLSFSFFAGCALSLYLQAFILPWTPIYQGDSSPIFLMESLRLLRGEVIYRDFFELTFPGTQMFYAFLFHLFGARAWIPSASFIILGGALAWVGVIISRHLIEGPAVLLPSLLFLALGYCNERDPTHHWFSTLAVLGALAVLLPGRTAPRLAAAGALCGVATLFTQDRGGMVLAAFALFLIWEARRTTRSLRRLAGAEAWLVGSYALAVVLPLAYFAVKAGMGRLVYCTLLFPLEYYSLWYWNTIHVFLAEVPLFNSWLEWPAVAIWLSIYALAPAVYLIILVHFWREGRGEGSTPWDKLMLVNLTGLFLYFSVAFSPSWLRMCTAALPALILLVWLIQTSPTPFRKIALIALSAVGLALLIADPLMVQKGWHAALDTPAGRVAFLDESRYQKFRWVRDHTSPGDYLFQASDCDLYFPLGLRDPAQVAFLTATGYTRPGQIANVVQSLNNTRVRYVLWSVWLDVSRDPAAIHLSAKILAPLRAYLQEHYHLVRSFEEPDYEQVWELNGARRTNLQSAPPPVR